MATEVIMQQPYYVQPYPAGYIPKIEQPFFQPPYSQQQQQQPPRKQQKRRRGQQGGQGGRTFGAVHSKHRRTANLSAPRTVPWAPPHSMQYPEGTPSFAVRSTPSAEQPVEGWEGENSRLNFFATNPGLVAYDSEDDDDIGEDGLDSDTGELDQHTLVLDRRPPVDQLSEKEAIIDHLRDENLNLKERIFLLEQEVRQLKGQEVSRSPDLESDQGVALC